MTTFHDLLGTNPHMPADEIKKRYKYLSHRLHPDKSGSSALMQMISLAYQQVLDGRGDEPYMPVNPSNEKLKLTQEYAKKLKEALQHQRQSNAKLAQQVADLQLALATQAADRVDATVCCTDELDTSLRLQAAATYPVPTTQHDAFSRCNKPLVVSVLLNVCLVAGGTLFYINTSAQKERMALIAQHNIVEPFSASAVEHDHMNEKTELMPPPIRLMSKVDEWQWEPLPDQGAYLAVRNKAGSYVVAYCDQQFYYFANMTQSQTQLPPNLVFEQHYQHFSIYKIAYGMGSTWQHWRESKSIKINREYFSNTHFVRAVEKMRQHCGSVK